MSDNIKAAGLMVLSLALLSLNDALIKVVALGLPLAQIVVVRNSVTSLALGFALLRGGRSLFLSRRDFRLAVVRGIGEIGSAYFYLMGLISLPFANVVAILQSAPLVVTLAAALFMGEKVGWRRLTAILIGFVGVLLIVRPGTEGFNTFTLYTLISVVFVTIRDLATRKLSPQAPALTVTAITSVFVLAFFLILAVQQPWVPMPGWVIVAILFSSAFVLGSYITTIQAMRLGEVAFVSPFRYSSLLWALLIGLLFFGEWPSMATLAGSAIIVGSGLFMLYRERKVAPAPVQRDETGIPDAHV